MLLLFLIQVSEVGLSVIENNACPRLYQYPLKNYCADCYVNPNVMALTPAIITQNGYKVLSYNVTTKDGYNLQLFRIPNYDKQPIFLQHGLFHDSSSWTLVGNRSLAFKLADRGYDVWLGNQRGTRYSRTKNKLDPLSFDYWTYSMDRIAANDIPASLEKIANVTGKPGSIIYIGHSRGTTLAFMYSSENPEQVQKLIRGIIALSPIVYFDMVGYVEQVMCIIPTLGRSLLSLGIPVIFYNLDRNFRFFFNYCSNFPYTCRFFIDITSGVTWQFVPDDLLTLYTHAPSTEAIMPIIQYAQMAIAGKFQKYDFGKHNLKNYGQDKPPVYKLENIKLPVFMFYGNNDIFIKRKSVRKIFDQLGSTRKKFTKIPRNERWEDQFSHNDFIWAKDLDTFLYKELFDVLENELQAS